MAIAAASSYAAASTSPGGASGAAATDVTCSPSRESPASAGRASAVCTTTSPRPSTAATNCGGCDGPAAPAVPARADRPRRCRRPSAVAGTVSKGTCHDTRVASAVASISRVSGLTSSGKRSMSPSVCSRAHASSAAWSGRSPRVTVGGSPASQPASPSAGRLHAAAADSTRSWPVPSSSAATGRRRPRPFPSDAGQLVAGAAGGGRAAQRQEQPGAEGEATWCAAPARACRARA